jgi:heme exporter protein B
MTTPFLQTISAIIRKDLRAELRSKELVSAMSLFTLLSILAFSFALELNQDAQDEAVSGILWVTLVFASILGLNRSLAQEREQGNLDAMMIAPVSRIAVYLGKLIGNIIFTAIVGLFLLPLMTFLFDISLLNPAIVLILLMGVVGLAAMGTLLATMTVQTRARETLLPIVMLPVALPVILVVVRATNLVLNGQAIPDFLLTMLLIDVIYVLLGAMLFEFVTED